MVGWLRAGLILGVVAMVLMLGPGLVEKVVGKPLPPDKDPLRRVRAWKATAGMVSAVRTRLLAEGKPVFVVAHHYGLTGLLSFYLPEARPVAGREPLVYSILGPVPENQFFFWPEYRYQQARKGQNAIYVAEADLPRYPLAAWFRSVLTGEPGPLPAKPATTEYLQPLAREFESIKDLGVFPILDHGGIYRWVQLVECRNLR